MRAVETALEELPPKLGDDVKNLMDDMGMMKDAASMHVERFVSKKSGEPVKQSAAFVTYPTSENDFNMSFLILTNNLEAETDHMVLICGHTHSHRCTNRSPFVGASNEYPCGESDMEQTGSFCELVNLQTSNDEGE